MLNIAYLKKHKEKIILVIPYIALFVFLFILCHSSTIMADDVRYSLRSMFNGALPRERITSFFETLESTYYEYLGWNSRFVTNIILSNVLRFDRNLWLFLNPLFITLSFYNVATLFDNKKTNVFILFIFLFSIFQLTDIVFDEVIIWITGSINYFWNIFAATYILKRMLVDKKANILSYILAVFLGAQTGSSIENLAISMSFIIVCITGYNVLYLKNYKYLNKERMLIIASVIFSNILSFVSPAVKIRSAETTNGMFFDISRGILSFFDFQYLKCGLIPLMLLVLLAIYIRKYSKLLSNISLIMIIPYCVIMISYLVNYEFTNNLILENRLLTYLFDGYLLWQIVEGELTLKFIGLLMWTVFTIPVAINILIIIFVEKNPKLGALCLLSTLPNLALIPLGLGSVRASFFSQFFMMSAVYSLLISINAKISKKISIFICLINIYLFFTYLPTYYKNIKVGQERTRVIEKYLINPDDFDEIIFPKYAASVHGNFDNVYTWENAEYKKYYLNLKENQKLFFLEYDEYFKDK